MFSRPRSLALSATCLLSFGLAACGLRTDPDYSPICVDEELAGGGTAETGGTGDTGGTGGMPMDPRPGSCQDPVDLPAGETIIVRGKLGGCSGVEGWCGGTGGEDVYRIGSVNHDVFVRFLPQETNFNPVLRVVRGEDPCAEGTLETSEVCADITNSVPGRGFYDEGAIGQTYYIIVDTELGESGEYAFELSFGEEAFGNDCEDSVDEQLIELMPGGEFVWEAGLEAEQGRIDSLCGAPGDEDLFEVVLTGAGTLSATVEAIEGDIMPIVSIREDCGTTTELNCGPTAAASFGGSTNTYLAVDQLGAAKGRYRLTVSY